MTAGPLMSTPDVSVIVVSYNTRDMTLACLRSLFEETSGALEVIVVDNDSADGSADAIEREFPAVRLIRSPDNLGFAGANNLAAERATAELLLLLNPDTVVLDGAVDELVGFARRRPEARVWGGRTLFPDRSLNPTSCWGFQSMWSLVCNAAGLRNVFSRTTLFNPEGYGGWARDDEREVGFISGCFFLIERELWNELGGFDLEFFMYGEEADLCVRARERGARPAITPRATIIHYGGASERVRADKLVRVLRARVQLLRKHWSPFASAVGVRLTLAYTVRTALTHRVLAALGRGGSREAASVWGEVVSRRREWALGPTAPAAGGGS